VQTHAERQRRYRERCKAAAKAAAENADLVSFEATKLPEPAATELADPAVTEDKAANGLPSILERNTFRSMREIGRILDREPDWKDGNLLRAKVTAAGIVMNAQLRADEARLKAKVHTDTLTRLLKVVEKQKNILEADEPARSPPVLPTVG
jgi:hypothetical protein